MHIESNKVEIKSELKKLTLFPNDKRVIVNRDVSFEGNSFRISAVAFSPEHPL